jgi:hypothetical protein
VECNVARNIWKRVADWVGAASLAPENWNPTDNLKDWILGIVDGLPRHSKEALTSLVLLVIWEIWRERNSRIFRHVCRFIPQILTDIQDVRLKPGRMQVTKGYIDCCFHLSPKSPLDS